MQIAGFATHLAFKPCDLPGRYRVIVNATLWNELFGSCGNHMCGSWRSQWPVRKTESIYSSCPWIYSSHKQLHTTSYLQCNIHHSPALCVRCSREVFSNKLEGSEPNSIMSLPLILALCAFLLPTPWPWKAWVKMGSGSSSASLSPFIGRLFPAPSSITILDMFSPTLPFHWLNK